MTYRDKEKTITKLIKRDGTRCHYCGCELNFTDPNDAQYRTLDHKYPQAKGGHSNPGNLVLSCHDCNIKKGQQNYRVFKEQEGRYRK